jgi:hypothetical protein
VLCSKGSDRDHQWKVDQLHKSIDFAKSEGIVLQTYGHAPSADNSGIDIAEVSAWFDYAYEHHVPMVTFTEIANGYDAAGWSFSIDDLEVDTWWSWRDALKAHHAKLTFFVTRYADFTPEQKQKLRDLAADGHDIQAHGKQHLAATLAVEKTGFDAYYADEVKPSVDVLLADGYHPIAFAYPYGMHTPDIDAKMLPHFTLLRTTGAQNCY